ncbi:glycosyltransferase [Fodinisporobacter ferrooxydans]|uniref:Glycosyltransferase n=1 Tax=Fodinisporobacter ferrooxydans TaxID=2901836 RepID=A0ABY4CJN7_9BACL|nr:glycosyltransferase [Alicyclobacillaceae bacterium MYW30-H2]
MNLYNTIIMTRPDCKIRLLIVLDGFFVGGTETQVLTVARELMKTGVHVVIVGKHGPLYDSFVNIGCSIYLIDFPISISVTPSKWLTISKELQNIIEKENINVIHAHQTTSARFVVSISKKLGIPLVFTVHGTYYDKDVLKSILKNTTRVISVSLPTFDWLKSKDISSIIIPNCIDTELYKPILNKDIRETYNISKNEPVVLYAGRLAWEKADICIRMLHACKYLQREQMPDLRVLIAGDGIGFKEIKQVVDRIHGEAGTEFIHALGIQFDMAPLYSISNCVVGTGRVALEAMACKCPVIAAGGRGLFGLVKPSNYTQAWQCYFGDHKADREVTEVSLAVSLATVLLDSEERKSLGEHGREYVKNNFNSCQVSQKILELYISLI